MNNLDKIINTNKSIEEEEAMANNTPVAKKESVIEEHSFIVDVIHYVGNDFMMTKQLLELLKKMGYGSSISNQMAISELIKNDVVTKKQALGSKNNILVLNAIAIAHYTHESTKNVSKPALSDKSIINSIQKIELIIQYIPSVMKYYQTEALTALDIREYFITQGSTYTLLPKHSVEYYQTLDSIFIDKDLWGDGFYDDIAVLKVEHANAVNQLAKYEDKKLNIKESDQNIFDMITSLKESMNANQISKEFWNMKNLMNSSCDVNWISYEGNQLEGQLVIYDCGNLCTERIAQFASWFYLMLDRYKKNYKTQIHITVYIDCLNKVTLEAVQKDCNLVAEDKFGYSLTTRLQSLMYTQGLRFPFNTENVDLKFIDSNIENKYGIIL